MTHHSNLLLLTGLSASLLCLASSSARADSFSVRVGGGVHVEARAAVHINLESAFQMFGGAHAGLDFGMGFAEPPPPPPPPQPQPQRVVVAACTYRCSPAVPSYYVEETYAQVPEPVFIAPARPMERWGLGVFAGSLHVEGFEDGADLGVMGRYRLSSAFSLEVELAKTTTEMNGGGREDRHLGGALLFDLSPYRVLSPFLLVGGGFGQTEIGDGKFHAEQGYGEVGVGLQYRLTDSFHIIADIRTGVRHSKQDVAYMSLAPVPDSVPSLEREEEFSRARIGGLLFF